MNRTVLLATGIETSAVGFGTAGLTSAGNERSALRLLDVAFHAGITHFDTAPLYGRGQTERLLGKFLRGKRGRITVATKVGLYPSTFDRTFRAFLTPLRWLKHTVSRPADVGPEAVPARMPQRGNFDPKQVKMSFETSLRGLQTDYIDLLLLHECFIDDTLRPDLIEFIGRQIERGTIRAAGLGTARSNLQHRVDAVPDLYRVFQYENNTCFQESALPDSSGRALITHTALGPLARIVSIARNDSARAVQAKSVGEIDYTHASPVASMLLHYARRANPNGVLLFATTNVDHLHDNLESLRREVTDEQVSAFAAAARALFASA